MISELLQQVRVIDPVSHTDRVADVLIADGVIKAVEDNIGDFSAETQLRDCQGLVLGPGLVDLYSHSGEPGFEERENIASLMAAATAGGFTRLCILPDTTPPIDNPAGVASIDRIKVGAKCAVGGGIFWEQGFIPKYTRDWGRKDSTTGSLAFAMHCAPNPPYIFMGSADTRHSRAANDPTS